MSWFLFVASLVVVKIVISRILPQLVTNNKGRRAYTWVIVSGVFLLTVACWPGIYLGLMQDLGTLERSVVLTFVLAFPMYGVSSYSFLARKRLTFSDEQEGPEDTSATMYR